MNETSKKIKELREQVWNLEKEIQKMEAENSNYYVLVLEHSYSDEYRYYETTYMLLGYMTEEQAKKHKDEYQGDSWYDHVYYEEVSEEDYNLYKCWLDLESLSNTISSIGNDTLNNQSEFAKLLGEHIFNILDKLDVRDDSDVKVLKQY